MLNPKKLCDDIILYFEQNSSIFDVLDIVVPSKNALLQQINEYKDKLEPYIIDTTNLIWKALDDNKKVLLEGAQGTMLDIDHGTYPYVTSSSTVSAGACTGLGLNAKDIGNVIGIVKAYCTKIGRASCRERV